MQIIPIDAVPSQSLTALLGGQVCRINLYQKRYGLFLDLFANDAPVITGGLCLDRNRLVRSTYLGFLGDLILFDTAGTSDPTSDGLGARFLLGYLDATEVIAA